MPHWRTLIPSDYLKAADFAGRDVTLTIAKVERRELDKLGKPGTDSDAGEPQKRGPAPKEKRGVVTFRETEKFLPLNVTNACSLAALWGDDYMAWAGHRVTLFPGRDRLGRDEVDAIRVRGAPDLAAPIEFEIPRPRRKPLRVRLVPTGKAPPPPSESAAPTLTDAEIAEIEAREREAAQ